MINRQRVSKIRLVERLSRETSSLCWRGQYSQFRGSPYLEMICTFDTCEATRRPWSLVLQIQSSRVCILVQWSIRQSNNDQPCFGSRPLGYKRKYLPRYIHSCVKYLVGIPIFIPVVAQYLYSFCPTERRLLEVFVIVQRPVKVWQ